jgi:hypothetical protein
MTRKVILVCIFAMLALMFGPAAAQAATCSGTSCYGTDPQATGCAADARTVAGPVPIKVNGVQVAVVEQRWSNICKTNWSRVRTTDGKARYLWASITDDKTAEYQARSQSATTNFWSPQIYAPGRCTWAAGAVGQYLNDRNPDGTWKNPWTLTKAACG